MATLRRKDNKGRVLKEGEYQRSNGTYRFRWLDKRHKEHSIYAKTLEELRVEEKKILKDTLDGINANSNLTLNDMYERWREVKRGLKDNTFQNYQYMYDTFVKPDFGKGLLTEIKKSDVRRFYNYLKEKRRLKCSTIDSIHTVVHQVFDLAVGDDYIRNNPSDDALKELRRTHVEEPRDIRALTVKEQELFEYVLNDPRHKRWQPVFTAILWTGMRVGEITGLRWCDIDFEKNLISVNHTLVYYDQRKNAKGKCAYAIHTPKTKAGCRMIPMLPEVREALLEEKKYQELEDVKCVDKIDGYTNFVFLNRFGSVLNQGTLNKALDRIVRNCNLDVIEKGKRDAVILPPLSNHWLRHTFATRMVEAGMHPKALQEILGHKDISTTMNIYTDASTDFTSNEMEKFRVSRLESNKATYQSLTNDLPMITKLA